MACHVRTPHSFLNSPEYNVSNFYSIVIFTIGFIFGCTLPIYYEFGVELTYPTKESSSASMFTTINNTAALIVILTGGLFSFLEIYLMLTVFL